MRRKGAAFASSSKASKLNTSDVVAQDSQWIACDKCGKWRIVPGHVDISIYEGREWHCGLNEWDADRNSCSAEEGLMEEPPQVRERSGRLRQNKRRSRSASDDLIQVVAELSDEESRESLEKKYKYERKRVGPSSKEPAVGARGYLLKCPMCRPNRDYICGRCKAREMGVEYKRKRRQKSTLDLESTSPPDDNGKTKRLTKKQRQVAVPSVPGSIITFVADETGGIVKKVDLKPKKRGRPSKTKQEDPNGTVSDEDGDQRTAFKTDDVPALEDELGGYLPKEEGAFDDGKGPLSKDSSGNVEGLPKDHNEDIPEADEGLVDGSAVFGMGVDSLWGVDGLASRRRKRAKPRTSKRDPLRLPDGLKCKYQDAIEAYMSGELDRALGLFLYLIKEAPQLMEAYSFAALVYESQHQESKAISMYLNEASHQRDKGLRLESWKKAARLANEVRDPRRLQIQDKIKADQQDAGDQYMRVRAVLEETRNAEKTLVALKVFRRQQPHNFNIFLDVGEGWASVGRPELAVPYYMRYIYHIIGSMDMDQRDLKAFGPILHPPDISTNNSSSSLAVNVMPRDRALVGLDLGEVQEYLESLFHSMQVVIDAFLSGHGGEGASGDIEVGIRLFQAFEAYLTRLQTGISTDALNDALIVPKLTPVLVILGAVLIMRGNRMKLLPDGKYSAPGAGQTLLRKFSALEATAQRLGRDQILDETESWEPRSSFLTAADYASISEWFILRQKARAAAELYSQGAKSWALRLLGEVSSAASGLESRLQRPDADIDDGTLELGISADCGKDADGQVWSYRGRLVAIKEEQEPAEHLALLGVTCPANLFDFSKKSLSSSPSVDRDALSSGVDGDVSVLGISMSSGTPAERRIAILWRSIAAAWDSMGYRSEAVRAQARVASGVMDVGSIVRDIRKVRKALYSLGSLEKGGTGVHDDRKGMESDDNKDTTLVVKDAETGAQLVAETEKDNEENHEGREYGKMEQSAQQKDLLSSLQEHTKQLGRLIQGFVGSFSTTRNDQLWAHPKTIRILALAKEESEKQRRDEEREEAVRRLMEVRRLREEKGLENSEHTSTSEMKGAAKEQEEEKQTKDQDNTLGSVTTAATPLGPRKVVEANDPYNSSFRLNQRAGLTLEMSIPELRAQLAAMVEYAHACLKPAMHFSVPSSSNSSCVPSGGTLDTAMSILVPVFSSWGRGIKCRGRVLGQSGYMSAGEQFTRHGERISLSDLQTSEPSLLAWIEGRFPELDSIRKRGSAGSSVTSVPHASHNMGPKFQLQARLSAFRKALPPALVSVWDLSTVVCWYEAPELVFGKTFLTSLLNSLIATVNSAVISPDVDTVTKTQGPALVESLADLCNDHRVEVAPVSLNGSTAGNAILSAPISAPIELPSSIYNTVVNISVPIGATSHAAGPRPRLPPGAFSLSGSGGVHMGDLGLMSSQLKPASSREELIVSAPQHAPIFDATFATRNDAEYQIGKLAAVTKNRSSSVSGGVLSAEMMDNIPSEVEGKLTQRKSARKRQVPECANDSTMIVKSEAGQYILGRNVSSNIPRGPYDLHQRDRDVITSAAAISDVCSEAMYRLLLDPYHYAAANLVSHESRRLRHDGIERFCTVQRLFNKCSDSVAATLLHAHESAARRRYSDALDRYLDSFILDPHQPLTSLCVCSLMIFFAHHYLVGERLQVLLKGLAFLQQYQLSRRAQKDHLFDASVGSGSSDSGSGSSSNTALKLEHVTAAALEQEILYNTGRALQELKLNGMAVCCYRDALTLADTQPSWCLHKSGEHSQSEDENNESINSMSASLHVTRECAHNLVTLLKQSNAMDKAYEVMRKYLSYD